MARWTHDALDRLAARVASLESSLTTEVDDSIHDNVAGEIVAVTEKTAPVDADVILLEDSASSDAKKRVQLGNISRTAFVNMVLYDPAAGREFGLWYVDRAITVKQIRIWFYGMTAVSTIVRYGARNSSAWTNLVNGSWWGNATYGADATLNATSVPADQVIWCKINALTGASSPYEVGYSMEYEYTR